MKRVALFLWLVFVGLDVVAESTETLTPFLPIEIQLHDKASLQRGAAFFMNYCSGCHSLRYLRYNRMAEDLGLTTFTGEINRTLLTNNLIFTKASISSPIKISMPPEDARQWFGVVPPDLSLRARQRGAAWIYTYLNSFYADKTRPFGTNNLLVRDVAMPDVLAPLSGRYILSAKSHNLIQVEAGEMTPQQFRAATRDVVNFLVYVGEPSQLIRYKIGVKVMLFLGIFTLLVYFLKKRVWRDVK